MGPFCIRSSFGTKHKDPLTQRGKKKADPKPICAKKPSSKKQTYKAIM